MHFEDAIRFVQNGGRARRYVWASVTEYTRTTPPLTRQRQWHIWASDSSGSIINGWGGQVGMELPQGEPIRDGQLYSPSNEDRVATDWELMP